MDAQRGKVRRGIYRGRSSSAVRIPVVRFMAVHSLSVMQCGRAARHERVQKPGNGRMDFAASWVLFILSQRRRVRKEIFCGACGKMKFLRCRRQSDGLPRQLRGSPFPPVSAGRALRCVMPRRPPLWPPPRLSALPVRPFVRLPPAARPRSGAAPPCRRRAPRGRAAAVSYHHPRNR